MRRLSRGRGRIGAVLLTACFASNLLGQAVKRPPAGAPPSARSAAAGPSVYQTTALTARARAHYQILWGIDGLEVKAVESGELIRFSYLVVDPAKATQLTDKKIAPTLIDPEARVTLAVPSVDQVGQLRQSTDLVAGKSYWMLFANKRREVKRGDRISIVIGKFRADGLYVQ